MAYTKKVEIQALATSADEIGQVVQNWETVLTAWAETENTGGREYYSAKQTNSEDDFIFKVRYSRKIADFLTSEIRIVYNGKIFNVKHIEDVKERHLEIVFRTEQIDGDVRK